MLRSAFSAFVFATAIGSSSYAGDGWGNLDQLIFSTLGADPGIGAIESSTWMPDHADPLAATEAVVFLYYTYATGGNAVGLLVGYFTKVQGTWAFQGPVTELFGLKPRELAFEPEGIYLTTTVLLPGEARCCPTGVARWQIDRESRTARRKS